MQNTPHYQFKHDVEEIKSLLRQVINLLDENEKPQKQPTTKLLNYEETAKLLNIQPGTLRTWRMQNRIPHIKLAHGRAVRFDQKKIQEWIEKDTVNPVEAANG